MLINNPTEFDLLEIGLASPDRIRFWSYGEIEKPETINYRTFKPERKGLFCEKIFGPVKDWECSCGKYRRVRYRGIVCERCGVEVTHSKVRRERMGHIELAAPVTHIWFLKGIPSYMGVLLDISTRKLEEVIYYDSYIVTNVDDTLAGIIEKHQTITTQEYLELKEKYKNKFQADIGANAVKTLLADLDLPSLTKDLRKNLEKSKGQKRLKLTKGLRVAEALLKSGNNPSWMVLDVIPVMPPDLRPMVQLEGGRFATSDLNDLYRRVVNRNNRLKRLMDIGAPEMICRNEKRMLQEAVDVLISNGKRGRSVTGSNGRPLKSLGNIIEGKQGRFRQNLLGKRVDYSARSVIVVGPHLKFYQCGLPKEMALELFKPFVIRNLVSKGFTANVKSAKRKIEKRDVEIWDILEEVIKGQPVLLNRAPTLHRLGIQAFEPILVEGSAIQIPPLVCTAFNADFDGDQMAVHVPLSLEAVSECKLLIRADNNILSPSNGRSIITPTQDMVLGCYFLTILNDELEASQIKCFHDINEAIRAHEQKYIELQQPISIRIDGERITTTIGRVILNKAIWEECDRHKINRNKFINYIVAKKELSELIYNWYIEHGSHVTSEFSDQLKKIGFKYSTLSGISISIDDLTVPKKKAALLDDARKEVESLELLHRKGDLTIEERRFRSNDIWRSVTQQISDELELEMGRLNNVYIMAHSGARGNIDQVRQLAGMRGLMSDSQGRTVEIPIRSNFKEGLTLTEYFISAYGARKGLVDTALRTADSGYLTRRLVDVSQDVMVTIEDCGVKQGVTHEPIRMDGKVIASISQIIEGRYSLETISHPETNKVMVKKGNIINRELAKEIENAGIDKVTTRSVYHCQADRGICQKCYGLDLATAKPINLGEAAGIIAAQSIGEPGTQLTMRTFHTGGVDLRKSSKVTYTTPHEGEISFPEKISLSKIKVDNVNTWILNNDIAIKLKGKKTTELFLTKGSILSIKDKDKVKANEVIGEYDPTFTYIVSNNEGKGVILYYDKDNKSKSSGEIFILNSKNKQTIKVSKEFAEKCQVDTRVSFESNSDHPELVGHYISKINPGTGKTSEIECYSGVAYPFNKNSELFIKNNEKVLEGDILIKDRTDSEDASKTSDIVQGLPRVEELFEARKPKEAAILAETDGILDIKTCENRKEIVLIPEEGKAKEYKIALSKRSLVYAGQEVKKGDQLTEGRINPHDILATKGVEAAQVYLGNEVLKVYTSQGVQINCKHIEVIVRQMTRKIKVLDMGDSTFLLQELVDKYTFDKVNAKLKSDGKKLSLGERTLLGITRASLSTESFVSASSFQQTASVLTKAAVEGQNDIMAGLKENVIIGKLIPAGTGLKLYKRVKVDYEQEESNESIEVEETIDT